MKPNTQKTINTWSDAKKKYLEKYHIHKEPYNLALRTEKIEVLKKRRGRVTTHKGLVFLERPGLDSSGTAYEN